MGRRRLFPVSILQVRKKVNKGKVYVIIIFICGLMYVRKERV